MDKKVAERHLPVAADYLAKVLRNQLIIYKDRKAHLSPYGTDGWYMDVGCVAGVSPKLWITVWVINSIDPKKSIYWAGFALGKSAKIVQGDRLYDLCPKRFNPEKRNWVWEPPRKRFWYLDRESWNTKKRLSGHAICELEDPTDGSFGIYSAKFGVQDLKRVSDFITTVLERLRKSGGFKLSLQIKSIEELPISETEKNALVKLRIGQGRFRKGLDNVWEGKCAVLGLETREVLRASHIKPWHKSTSKERMDPNNGILLSAHLDALFDRSLITFDDEGKILISKALQKDKRELRLAGLKLRLRLNKESRTYLKSHRDNFHAKEAASA